MAMATTTTTITSAANTAILGLIIFFFFFPIGGRVQSLLTDLLPACSPNEELTYCTGCKETTCEDLPDICELLKQRILGKNNVVVGSNNNKCPKDCAAAKTKQCRCKSGCARHNLRCIDIVQCPPIPPTPPQPVCPPCPTSTPPPSPTTTAAPFIVTLYPDDNFNGKPEDVLVAADGGSCAEIPDDLKHQASSVDAHGHCVVLYDGSGCQGATYQIPAANSRQDLWANGSGFNDRAQSLRSC